MATFYEIINIGRRTSCGIAWVQVDGRMAGTYFRRDEGRADSCRRIRFKKIIPATREVDSLGKTIPQAYG
jgi:hypothetical protein